QRPDLFTIVSSYISLRKVGKEFVGQCPFHPDRHPSLYVNPDKQVFHCFVCDAKGDVISFIERAKGVDFKVALRFLKMDGSCSSPGRKSDFDWVKSQAAKMDVRIRELDEEIEIADEIPNPGLAESLWNERRILADLRDDLLMPHYRADFIQIKDVIEKIV